MMKNLFLLSLLALSLTMVSCGSDDNSGGASTNETVTPPTSPTATGNDDSLSLSELRDAVSSNSFPDAQSGEAYFARMLDCQVKEKELWGFINYSRNDCNELDAFLLLSPSTGSDSYEKYQTYQDLYNQNSSGTITDNEIRTRMLDHVLNESNIQVRTFVNQDGFFDTELMIFAIQFSSNNYSGIVYQIFHKSGQVYYISFALPTLYQASVLN